MICLAYIGDITEGPGGRGGGDRLGRGRQREKYSRISNPFKDVSYDDDSSGYANGDIIK